MGDWEEDAPEQPKHIATVRFKEAKKQRDLVALSAVLSDIANGRLVPEWTEVEKLAIEIRKLKGALDHSDVRGWKRSGKINKDEVALDCRRALEAMGQKCGGSIEDAEEAYGRARPQNGKPATLKRIPTGEFLVRIRNCTGNNGKR